MNQDEFLAWLGKVGLNLCGEAVAALEKTREVLTILTEPQTADRYEKLCTAIPDAGVRHIYIQWLDDAGLVECSSPPDGSWLTDTGRAVLDFLIGMSTDQLDELLG